MRLTAILVQEGGVLTLETDPSPSKEWLDDGLIRWLNVEGATREELIANLREALAEAIEMNREHARKAAGESFEEVAIQP